MNTRRLVPALAISVVAILGSLALSAPVWAAHSSPQADVTSLQAHLDGFGQVPPVITTGTGRFQASINADGTITYTLRYSQLAGTGAVNFADIHFGQRQANGGVILFLCSNVPVAGGGIIVPAGTPPCPNGTGTGATVTGTVGAAGIVGPTAQGITPGNLAAALEALRSGLVYSQVHTVAFPGGEIRGQIGNENSG